jgi:hypothetical protein
MIGLLDELLDHGHHIGFPNSTGLLNRSSGGAQLRDLRRASSRPHLANSSSTRGLVARASSSNAGH